MTVIFLFPMYEIVVVFHENLPNGLLGGIYDGWICFLGLDREFHSHVKPRSYSDCTESLWLVILYVVSNLFVLVSVSSVIRLSSHLVGRMMAIAVLVAFIAMCIYDWEIVSELSESRHHSRRRDDDSIGDDGHSTKAIGEDTTGEYSRDSVGILDVIALISLLAGMEIYGRDAEPDEEAITNFSPACNIKEAYVAAVKASKENDFNF